MRKLLAAMGIIGMLGLALVPLFGASAVVADNGGSSSGGSGGATIPKTCEISQTNQQRINELTGEDVSSPTDNGLHCLLNTLITIQQWTFYFFLVVALIMILVGAFMFVTAGGKEEQTANARRTLIYALVGIAVAFLARIALQLAQNLVV